MELMNVLSQIPLPVVVAVVTVLVIVTLVCVYQYTKMKGLDGIRGDVYQLILKAEHVYNASGQGEQKLKWVVQQARYPFSPDAAICKCSLLRNKS